MRLIDRYIVRTVVGTALVALLVLLALETFFTLLDELQDLGAGSYGLREIGLYLLLTLPRRAYETFPMALLLGGLMGMGNLAAGSELVVMRGAGVSILRLVLAAMKGGLILGLIALVIGEFAAPHTERMAEDMRSAAKDRSREIREGRGFWARDGERFVNVRAVLPHKRLADIYIYELDERAALRSVTYARSARYDRHGRQWVLEEVRRSDLRTDTVTVTTEAAVGWRSVIDPSKLEVLAAKPETLAMRDLLTFSRYLEDNGLDADAYALAFWSKALGPLANLTMLFVAMPFVFGHQRSASAGKRLMIGIFLGLGFFLLSRVFANLAVLYGAPPLFAAALPSLLFVGGGAWALARMR